MTTPHRTTPSSELPPSERADAFMQLLHAHRGQVFGCIFSMVHRIADAEDVYQETCASLWSMFDAFMPGTDFAAWACSTARYKTLAYLQKHQRERSCFGPELLEQLAAQSAAQSDLISARLAALHYCREKLPAADAELLTACYRPEISIKEAAESLGRPVGSVYDSLSRIRRALFHCIQRRLTREGTQ